MLSLPQMTQEKIYSSYRKWRTANRQEKDGILVATDLTQEWLLPWWWQNYRKFNTHPVAFVDLGMSEEAKEWCKERGEWIPLPVADIFVATKEEVTPSLVEAMEKACGNLFWTSRNAWFKKPLACLQSPFRRTIWIDLDCQVQGAIEPLFSTCESMIAMVSETERFYNSGVIVFKEYTPLIESWADAAFERNHEYRGDQDILNQLIQEQNLPVFELPESCNWMRIKGENPEALIMHWHGQYGKEHILHQMRKENLNSLYFE